MPRPRPRIFLLLFISVGLFAMCSTRSAEAAPSSRPEFFILAPQPDFAKKTNLLPLEATLRAVAIELAARGVRVSYVPARQLPALDKAAYPRLEFSLVSYGARDERTPMLHISPKDSRPLANIRFDRNTWQALTAGISAARDSITDAIASNLKIPPPIIASSLTEAQRSSLDSAFETICEGGPLFAINAAAAIDNVLSAQPGSPAALTAACWPSCILGSQDLRGCLQLRDRWLAVPLSWWVAAQQAAARAPTTHSPPSAQAHRATLTEAWVALLCGFPKETLALLESLPQQSSPLPLARALSTFATRDWRPAEKADLQGATAVEQLAWIWAIQECKVFVPRADQVLQIMLSRGSAAFGPLYGIPSVGDGHSFTTPMVALAATESLRDITSLPALEAEPGESILRKAAGPDMPDATIEETCRRLFRKLASGEPDARTVALLKEAFDIALASPDGPLAPRTDPAAWQSLSPWAWAQASRGLFYKCLQLRGKFLFRNWGVKDKAAAFLEQVLAGLEENSPEWLLFRSYLGLTLNEKEALVSAHQNFFRTEMGKHPAQWNIISRVVHDDWLESVRRQWRIYHHPCGSWQSQMCLSTCLEKAPTDASRRWYNRCVENDFYNTIRIHARSFESPEPNKLLALARAMPHCYDTVRMMGFTEIQFKRTSLAAELCKIAIEVAPDYVPAYRTLANAHVAAGNKREAIKILREGCTRSYYNMTTGHCMRQLARLLTEVGEIKEAAEWSERTGGSYSYADLIGKARFLAGRGKTTEALEEYRKAAFRYGHASFDYLVFAITTGMPQEKVEAEAMLLAEEHPEDTYVESIAAPLMMYGHFEAAQATIERNPGIDDPVLAMRYRGLLHLMKQEFDAAAEQFTQAARERYFRRYGFRDPAQAGLQAYIAMCLAHNEQGKSQILDFFSAHKNFPQWANPIVEYLRGAVTRDEALEMARDNESVLINLYWLFAAEEDGRADTPKALQWYRRAAGHYLAGWQFAGCFARDRLKALTE